MIIVFTMKGCEYCEKLIKLMRDDGIEFTKMDINSEVGKIKFNAISSIAGDSVPIILVNKNVIAPNKSFKTIDQAFEIIKTLI